MLIPVMILKKIKNMSSLKQTILFLASVTFAQAIKLEYRDRQGNALMTEDQNDPRIDWDLLPLSDKR